MLSNLPEELTPLVGRRRELAEVRGLLVNTRVLTLIGIGGVGKTRLARAVAADRRRAFPDGVWYADLDGIDDADLVEARVCDVLPFPVVGPRGRRGELPQSLRERHLLLILDNCERVVDGTARLVDAISRGCPDVRILAASRVPLRAAGDVVYQVPPLSFHPLEGLSPRDFDGCDAVRLFADRARQACSDFQLTPDNRAAVDTVIRHLDQLPLAIELAAVQLRTLTVQALAATLADHRAVLDWRRTSGPDRLQTIRSSLESSASLCSEGERRLWARLSAFRGTFDLDAVEAICGEGLSDDVLDLLQGLADRSIINREDHGAIVRYSMLGITRQFGHDMLEARYQESSRLTERHMSWYFDLVARAKAEENTARQGYWLHALPLEHGNLVRALDTAADDPGRVDAAAEAVCGLWRYYWWACGWESEGVYWVKRCARRLRTPSLRARTLLLGSLLAATAGETVTATTFLQEGRELAKLSRDPLAQALAEHVRGNDALWQGQPRIAVEHYRHALETYEHGATSHRVDTLLMLTLACAAMGDVEGAQAAHRETVDILPTRERFQRSYSLLYLGEALRRHGSSHQALVVVREALELKIDFDDPFGVAWALDVLAEIACDAGRFPHAALLMGSARRMWETTEVDEVTRERFLIRGDLTQARLRTAMGKAAFADHYKRGQLLSQEAAVAFALNGDPASARPPATSNPLTHREYEIASLVAGGLTNKQIASKLLIAKRTVDAHVQNILTKFAISSRGQIAALMDTGVERHGRGRPPMRRGLSPE